MSRSESRWRIERPSVVLGRKFCPQCGVWRPVHDFAARYLYAERPPDLHSYCKACTHRLAEVRRARERLDPVALARLRAYGREYRRAHPRSTRSSVDAARERWGTEPVVCGRRICRRCGRWRHISDFAPKTRGVTRMEARCRACVREANRESYRRAMVDPARAEARREYHRIYAEGQRRAAGVPARRWATWARVPDRERAMLVPSAPLIPVLRAELRLGSTIASLAVTSGVNERRIWQVLHQDTPNITLRNAEALALACGTTLLTIYDADVEPVPQRPHLPAELRTSGKRKTVGRERREAAA
jgi:hypothetical protein